MFVDEYIKIRITNLTIDRYLQLGYKCKIGDIIDISPMHCPNNGDLKIDLICDECGDIIHASGAIVNTTYKDSHVCKKCQNEKLKNRLCTVCGSTKGVSYYGPYNDLLCSKHKAQFRKYGKIVRTMRDKNEIIKHEDYAEFITRDIHGNENGRFKIDLCDIDFVLNHKLYKHHDGYACYKHNDSNGKKINKRIHRYVMNLDDTSDYVVDHINGDKSDNRRSNLRVVDSKINNINVKGGYSHNTSGITGVSQSKKNGLYESYIHKNNKKISLYHGKSFEDAVVAREIAELEYFGKYSPRYEELILKYNDCDIEVGKYFEEAI